MNLPRAIDVDRIHRRRDAPRETLQPCAHMTSPLASIDADRSRGDPRIIIMGSTGGETRHDRRLKAR